MNPVNRISGIAAPFPAPNIDTDQIVPSAFLTAVDRVGFGRALFHEQRFDGDGRPVADFVLNRPPYDRASILVAGDNFGCGSSREHAAWALVDFGIGCVVSTRVADIFFKNAVNNGLLPCLVTPEVHSALLAAAHDARPFVVDLATQTIAVDGQVHPFAIDAAAKQRLLSGEDLIDATLTRAGAIDAIEHALEASMPWLPRRVAS